MTQLELQPNEVYYCILVHFYVHPPAMCDTTGNEFNVKRVKRDMARFLLNELLGQHSLLYPSLQQLYVRLAQQLGEAGEEVAVRVHEILQGLATIHQLHALFDALESLITSGSDPSTAEGVHPQSQLGLLLRRCRILFRSMPFDAVTKLQLALQTELVRCPPPVVGRPGAPGPGPVAGVQQPRARLRPRHAVESALSHHVEQMGCQAAPPRLPAPSSPPEDRGIEEQLAALDLDLPQAILVQVAAAVRALDYTAAVEALHRHYDYSVPPISGGSTDAAGAGGGAPSPSPAAAGRSHQQQALMALSDVHALFGHTHEALQALSEALCIAQAGAGGGAGAGDQGCLLHCLALLHRLMMEAPGAPGLPPLGLGLGAHRRLNHHTAAADLLRRCLISGQILQLPHLVAFARLGQVRSAMLQRQEPFGNSMLEAGPAAQAPDSVQIQSAGTVRDLALLHHAAALDAIRGTSSPPPSPSAAGPAPAPALTEIYSEPAVHDGTGGIGARAAAGAVLRATGSSQLLRSHACSSAGSPALAHCHALMFLACYSGCCRREDTQLARALLMRLIRDKQGLDAAAAAAGEGGQGPGAAASSPWAPPGPSACPPESSKPLAVSQLSMALEAALEEGDVRQAQLLLHGMADLVSPAPGLDNDVRAQVLRHHAMVSIAAGRLPEAHAAAMDLFCLASHVGLQEEALQSLLLLAQLHVAAQDWSAALLHVLSALLHCSLLHYDALAAEALATLAHIWLHLDLDSSADLKLVLQEVLPFVLSSGSQTLRTKMFAVASEAEARVASQQ